MFLIWFVTDLVSGGGILRKPAPKKSKQQGNYNMPISMNKGPTLRSGRMLGDSNSDTVLEENSDQLRGAIGQSNDQRDDSTRPKTRTSQLEDQSYPELCDQSIDILNRTERGGGDTLDHQDHTTSHNQTKTTTMSVMDRYLLDKLAEVLENKTEATRPIATHERPSNLRQVNSPQGHTPHVDRRNGMGLPTSPLSQSRIHRLRPERSFELLRDPERIPRLDRPNLPRFEQQTAYQRHTNDHNRQTVGFYPQQPNTRQTPSNLPKMKAPQYDGTSSWPDYLVQFEMVAELNGWDDYTMAMYLATSLRGTAQSVLGDLDDHDRRDYGSLIACLNQRFGPENQTEMFRAVLHNRTRQPRETLPDLAHEIRKLVRLAYPTGERTIVETIALEHFIDALSDPDTKWRIQQTRPRTLDQAVRIAVELEAFQAANKQKSTKKAVRAVTFKDSTTESNQEIEEVVNRMQRLMTEGLQALERQVNELKSDRHAPQNRNSRRPVTYTCYHCGEKGHIRTSCPQLRKRLN